MPCAAAIADRNHRPRQWLIDGLKKVEQLRKQEQARKAEEKAKQGAEKK